MKRVTFMGFVFLLCFLVSCNKKEEVKMKPKEKVNLTSYLTGEVVSAIPEDTLMVMMNNAPRARPQTGLNLADVVVEMLAEGEITRFAAFYQSQLSGTIGPVRSVRDYFYALAKDSHAVLVSAGGAKGTLHSIRNDRYPHIDGVHGDDRYFWRVKYRIAPHNLYTKLEALVEGKKEKGFHLKSPSRYIFSSEPSTKSGEPAKEINLRYHPLYACGYQYDEIEGVYIRYTEGEKQVDRLTSKPITMKNILVVFATHRIQDNHGHRSIDLSGSGKGYLVQEGRNIPIEYRVRDGLIVAYSMGKEVPLMPGRTWVNVLPQWGKVQMK